MDAFISNEGVANYPSTYYATWDTWKNILKSGLYVAVTLVSDAFIVRVMSTSLSNLNYLQLYRSFIVWGRNYFIAVFPLLLFIADIGLSCSTVVLLCADTKPSYRYFLGIYPQPSPST